MTNTDGAKSTEELTLMGVIDSLCSAVKNTDILADKVSHIKSKLKTDPQNKPSEPTQVIDVPESLPERLNGIVNNLLYVNERIYDNLSTSENIIG